MKCSKCGHDPSLKTLNLLEAELIETTYKKHNKDFNKTSLELGVGRATLYRKLKQYGIV